MKLSELARRTQKYGLRTLDNNNIYQYTTPDFYTVQKRDFFCQILGTAITFALLIWLDVESILTSISFLEIELNSKLDPTPDFVLQLMEKVAAAKVTGLTCPCRVGNPTLPELGTTWRYKEDSYCSTLRGTLSLNTPDVLQTFTTNVLQSPINLDCIVGGVNGPNFAAFLAQIDQLAFATDMLPSLSGARGSPAWNAAVLAIADSVEDSLCAFAFGSQTQEIFQVPIPLESTELVNACAPGRGGVEDYLLGADAFDNSTTSVNIVPLSQSRAFSFFSASANMCNTMYTLRVGFEEQAQRTRVSTAFALSPTDLVESAETAFNNTLELAGLRADGWIPGFNPQDSLSTFTDPTNILAPVSRITKPPTSIGVNDFPFSSRLPFVRADFVNGGTKQFYVTTQYTPVGPPVNPRVPPPFIPILSGLARLTVTHPDPLSLPFKELADDRSTAGYMPGDARVPVGDDFITLLEACRSGYPLTVDVHNFRPLELLPPWNTPAQFSFPYNLAPAAGFAPGMCGNPAAGAPLNPRGSNRTFPPPQPILFSVPLACPPLITFIANLSTGSTYGNLTSPVRYSIRDYLALFPKAASSPATAVNLPFPTLTQAQQALLALNNRGDTAERVETVATVMVEKGGVSFSHSPLHHYASCKPVVCTWSEVSTRSYGKIALEAVASFGGNGSFIVSLTALIIAYFAFFGRRWDQYHKTPEEKRREKEEKKKEEEGGGPCNCPHCPCSVPVDAGEGGGKGGVCVPNPLSVAVPVGASLSPNASTVLLEMSESPSRTGVGEGVKDWAAGRA